jgi:hypothetical protein
VVWAAAPRWVAAKIVAPGVLLVLRLVAAHRVPVLEATARHLTMGRLEQLVWSL